MSIDNKVNEGGNVSNPESERWANLHEYIANKPVRFMTRLLFEPLCLTRFVQTEYPKGHESRTALLAMAATLELTRIGAYAIGLYRATEALLKL